MEISIFTLSTRTCFMSIETPFSTYRNNNNGMIAKKCVKHIVIGFALLIAQVVKARYKTYIVIGFSMIQCCCTYAQYVVSSVTLNYKNTLFRFSIDSNIYADGRKNPLRSEYSYIDSIQVKKIIYQSNGERVCGYVITPADTSKKYPCIIYNRGGNRDYGSLKLSQLFIELGRIAARGYVVAASNYRGSGCSTGKDEFGGADVDDVLNLIPVLGGYVQADTSRIGMYGSSRGGMMTYLCLARTNSIKAAVSQAGPSDLVRVTEERNEMENVFKELIPGYGSYKDSLLFNRSAVKWPGQFDKNCPLLLLHGTDDKRVSSLHAVRLRKLLVKHGVPVKLVLFKGDDHGLTKNHDKARQLIIDWFDEHLK